MNEEEYDEAFADYVATMSSAPEPEPPLPNLWFVDRVLDGEYTGPGDDPPGYMGEWEDMPRVVDIQGNLVCECVDIATARLIVALHNGEVAP